MSNNNDNIIDANDTTMFSYKELILLNGLTKFYENKKYLDIFLKYVDGQSDVSLRMFDWFITNFSKKKMISYKVKEDGQIKLIDVYLEYKSQLSAYTKNYFDPYCRKKKIYFHYGKNKEHVVITTISQLNCFRWAIKNKIIEYLENNLYDEVKTDLKESMKKNKLQKKKEKEKEIKKNINKNVEFEIDDEICDSTDSINYFSRDVEKTKDKINSAKRQELSKSIYKNIIIKNDTTLIK